jgi:hypothetical protein
MTVDNSASRWAHIASLQGQADSKKIGSKSWGLDDAYERALDLMLAQASLPAHRVLRLVANLATNRRKVHAHRLALMRKDAGEVSGRKPAPPCESTDRDDLLGWTRSQLTDVEWSLHLGRSRGEKLRAMAEQLRIPIGSAKSVLSRSSRRLLASA